MANDYAGAVRAGTMAAARLHQKLDLRRHVEDRGGSVDVFGAIHSIGLPLLLRPLEGLLGAFITIPVPGVLVTTQRPMSVQRFTAAHELGHFLMGHLPSLDDESVLRRMPLMSGPKSEFQEIEADAFAVMFMMPRWLIDWHANHQGWTVDDFRTPHVVYQLSLRIGASYEATCWTLVRHRLLQADVARQLVEESPRNLKEALLETYKPTDYRGDVWLLTERDAGTRVDGSRKDLFVLRLEEHCGGGYLWNFDQLRASGFAIVQDGHEEIEDETVGGNAIRRITTVPPEIYRGTVLIDERRPWDPATQLSHFEVELDLTGPEEIGLSRAERRSLLEAA